MPDQKILAKLTQPMLTFYQQNNSTYQHRPSIRTSSKKPLEISEIIEICILILIFLEHTFIFILTFKRKSPANSSKDQNQRSIILPCQSFVYSCLHRNWIRALSFSNICFSIVDFIFLILKHYHPLLVHQTSITFYSLPLNLLQQILTNFSTFHLFIISISVFQYFLRYYRLIKNTYSSYFFNGQNLLLTNHTNVALILSGSLALIFAYNYIFYAPQYPHTITLLPLITFNMILLPLINLIIFSFIIVCFFINQFFSNDFQDYSHDNTDQENLRLLIEKSTCIKCYTEIVQKNPNLFQDKKYSYRNFFAKHFRSSYPFEMKRKYCFPKKSPYSQTDFSCEQEPICENDLFLQTTFIHLNRQHSLCHLCYCLLLIFLLKYVLLTLPHYSIQMLYHVKQFYQIIIKHNLSTNSLPYPTHENKTFLSICSHILFLLSRFGDSFFFIRLSYVIRNYFPCWCQFNSQLLRRQPMAHQILTTKTSESSTTNESANINEKVHQKFRIKFQFMPIWSNNRPRLFQQTA